jgi:hypothetical protein
MSALARELRELAAIYFHDADKQANPDRHRLLASAWHTMALKLEAGVGLESVDDCTEVYGAPIDDATIFAHLDEFNDCADAGGHVWLAENGDVRCIHCGVPAMPGKASRETQ